VWAAEHGTCHNALCRSALLLVGSATLSSESTCLRFRIARRPPLYRHARYCSLCNVLQGSKQRVKHETVMVLECVWQPLKGRPAASIGRS
jgi:hypothetical protein